MGIMSIFLVYWSNTIASPISQIIANPTVGMPGHDTMQEGAVLYGIQLRDSAIDLMY
ncbi:hypothetical protein [Candidatus Nitrospira salsa]